MTGESIAELEPAQEAVLPRPKILIVDDDAGQADALAYRLRKQGFDALTSRTGNGGLALAQDEGPNLVLLDIRLPDVDGFEVCERLTSHPATCGIPVIIVSGVEHPDVIRKARSAGSSYYLRKPYDPNALLVLVQSALDEASYL